MPKQQPSKNKQDTHNQGLVSNLKEIHGELAAAVFEAYGWPPTLTDEEILETLLAPNLERAAEERRGKIHWLRPEYQNPEGTADVEQKTEEFALAAAQTPTKRAWPKGMTIPLVVHLSLCFPNSV